MSMKPGATAQPDASSSTSPRRFGAISLITRSAIATSATRPGAPVPSNTVPPRRTRMSAIGVSLIDHELQQVPVGIAHVHARRRRAATALSLDRALDDLGTRLVEQRAQRGRRPIPHQAEIAARWWGRGSAQREAALPEVGPMEVDHLVADVDRDHARPLRDRQTEGAVE